MLLVVGAVKAEVVFFASSSAVTAEGAFFTGSCVWYFGLVASTFFYKVC